MYQKRLGSVAGGSFKIGRTPWRVLNTVAGAGAVFLGAFIITALMASVFMPQQVTNADKITYVSNGSGKTLTLNATGSVSLNMSPTAAGSLAAGKDTLNIKTNATGYQLYLSMNSDTPDSNRLYQNGDATSSNYLAAAPGNFTTPVALTNDTWGYAVSGIGSFDASYTTPSPDAASKWAAVPLYSYAQLIKTATAANPDPGDNLDIYYGVKATTLLPSGTYSNTVAYTAIANGTVTDIATISPERTDQLGGGATVTIATNLSATAANVGTITVTIGGEACTNPTASNSAGGQVNIACTTPALSTGRYDVVVNIPTYSKTYYIPDGIEYYADVPPPSLATISNMQDMTPEVCDNSTIGDEATLTDTRDNNTYTVKKLADGRCWMTQNLRLGTKSDGSGETVASVITLTSADSNVSSNFTIPTSAVQTSGSTDWTGTVDAVRVYNNGNSWIQPTSAGSNATVNTSGTPDVQSKYIGNYYNWYTATAGTGTLSISSGNASSSICPKGWELPTSSANSDFTGLTGTLVNITTNTSSVPTQSFAMQSAPNYFALFGSYFSGSGVYYQGSTGYWWSSTANSSSDAYSLYLSTSYVYPQNGNSTKHRGFSVRCVAEGPKFSGIASMQDMTSEICAASAVGDEKILRDTRDNNTYTVRKMEDNNCWMTQNLRLGTTSTAVTLTSADSDVTSDFTIPTTAVQTSGSTDWSTNYDAVHVYDNGNTWIAPTSAGNYSTVNTSGTPPSQSQYVGNYYNWYTATAGTGTQNGVTSGNASSSICPKGWRLPTGSANSDFTGLTGALVNITTSNSSVPTQSFTMQSSPNYFVLSGIYNSGVNAQGSYGRWWSRTTYNATSAYFLYLDMSSVYPQNYSYKYYGASVRCIAR